jgi:hypothetical protein
MVPIPTVKQPENSSIEGMTTFAEILHKVHKLGGLSAPKLMEVRGSDGDIYKLIFKVFFKLKLLLISTI